MGIIEKGDLGDLTKAGLKFEKKKTPPPVQLFFFFFSKNFFFRGSQSFSLFSIFQKILSSFV